MLLTSSSDRRTSTSSGGACGCACCREQAASARAHRQRTRSPIAVETCWNRMDAREPLAVKNSNSVVPSGLRSEEHTSELQSLMRISYAVFCLKKKKTKNMYTA